MNPELVVRSRRVVTGGEVRPAAVHIRKGWIAALSVYDDVSVGAEVYDAADAVVMPGLVDTHVHINEPGRTEWEGFATATRAAAAGGVTTLVEMPLNSIPATTTVAAFREKLAAADGQCAVDAGFWGGVVPGNAGELTRLWEAGVFGFKCFLVDSGVPEFPPVTEADLRRAVPVLARLDAPLLVHAEVPGPIDAAVRALGDTSRRSYATWLRARPRAAETEAIALVAGLAQEFGARVHIVHLASSDALEILRRAREQGTAVTAETCPHYLTFAAEEIPDGATEFKCAPPIRERENRERLWQALADGEISLVVTDHSPCPPGMKHPATGDFLRAWGGVASLELSLAATWTEAQRRGCSLPQLVEWMCAAPARLAGLVQRKGQIAPGRDADLVVWHPERTLCVEPEKLEQRHKLTPYAGRTLAGVVEATFLRGQLVYSRTGPPLSPTGRILLRGQV